MRPLPRYQDGSLHTVPFPPGISAEIPGFQVDYAIPSEPHKGLATIEPIESLPTPTPAPIRTTVRNTPKKNNPRSNNFRGNRQVLEMQREINRRIAASGGSNFIAEDGINGRQTQSALRSVMGVVPPNGFKRVAKGAPRKQGFDSDALLRGAGEAMVGTIVNPLYGAYKTGEMIYNGLGPEGRKQLVDAAKKTAYYATLPHRMVTHAGVEFGKGVYNGVSNMANDVVQAGSAVYDAGKRAVNYVDRKVKNTLRQSGRDVAKWVSDHGFRGLADDFRRHGKNWFR